jgi:hypothetical protein
MQLSRKIAGEFAAVFLIGAVVGGLVAWDCTTDTELTKFMTKTNDSDSVMVARINQKYVDEYHLTSDEIARIQPTVKEMAQKMSHIRHQFGIDIISTYGDYHDKIAEQLTPDHRAAYEKASTERKKQLSDLLKLDQNPSDPGQK